MESDGLDPEERESTENRITGEMGLGCSKNNGDNNIKQIFILSGQSNMAGRGGVHSYKGHKKFDGFLPPECQPDPNIFRFNAHLNWVQAHEPLHVDIDTKKSCGIGPGMPFAKAIRNHDPSIGVVGLVPCAVGGTAIKEWEKGCHLYENMVKRAKESVRRSGGQIRAILWYQGESDASQHVAESYKANMERFIHDVRSDLGSPSLPIIQVALASAPSGNEKWMEKVREAQMGIKLPNVVCVDAKGLGLKEDNLHLTTEAQLKLGHILADAYLNNFASTCCCMP